MELVYRLAADLVVAFHATYVLFVVVGFLLILIGILLKWSWIRNLWFRLAHLAAILIVVAEAWLGITCPLTTWEKALRAEAGQSTYRGDFVANLIHELLFFDARRGSSRSATPSSASRCWRRSSSPRRAGSGEPIQTSPPTARDRVQRILKALAAVLSRRNEAVDEILVLGRDLHVQAPQVVLELLARAWADDH